MLPRPLRSGLAIVGVAALALNTACYSYLPAVTAAHPVGQDVRVELTAEGSSAVQAVVGPRIRVIEGRIRVTDPSGNATLDVEQLTSWEGLTVTYAGRDAVVIPQSAIQRVSLRTLNRQRSWVAGGVIGGIFVGVVVAAMLLAKSRASGDPGRIGGSPPDLRVP